MQRNKGPCFDQPVLWCRVNPAHTQSQQETNPLHVQHTQSGNPLCQFSRPLVCTNAQVGYKVPWTAISSLLHQFNQQFQQPKVLLWLNLAYFLPSMPALLLHSSLQDVLERELGVPKAALARYADCTTSASLTSAGVG